ncbi:MAG: hypothetical protein ACJ75H_19300 [Thermoanaerobaculia bacterium]
MVRHLGSAYHPNWIGDLRARCFAYLGNARRVLGELRSAEDAFVKAETCLSKRGTGNMEVKAEILNLKSSLRRAQRRFPEALDSIDHALLLYLSSEDHQGAWRTALIKAKILEDSGDLPFAIEHLQQILLDIDGSREPTLSFYARFNLLSCLIAAERHSEAEQILPEIRSLLQGQAGPIDLLRLHWMEGLIDLGLSRLDPAESAFREVQREFLDREMGYDAALVSLDLARLYAQEGRTKDLKRLSAELMPIFRSRDVHREAILTLLMFQQACEEERLTVDLVRQFAESLRRERRGHA